MPILRENITVFLFWNVNFRRRIFPAMASTSDITEWPTDKGLTENPYLYVLEDYTQRVISSLILAIVFLVGIPGNTLVILAVTLSRRLRSPTYWFVVNLAVTDLITCIFIPFQMVALLSQQGWPLPEWICAVCAGVTLICLTSSTTSLALIAFNRWYLITKPLGSFQKMFQMKNSIFIIACACLYSVLLVVVPPLVGIGAIGYTYQYKTCTFVDDAPRSAIYSVMLWLGMFILPTIPIVTFYSLIYRFVRRHTLSSVSITMTSHGVSSASQVSVVMPESEHGSPSSTQNDASSSTTLAHPSTMGSTRDQINITKKLAIIVCTFFACFIPIMICLLFMSATSARAYAWIVLLVFINSCLNPLIYARTIPAFRGVMWCILRCRYADIPEPIGLIRRFRLK